jgi:hypothetical protein
LNTTIIEVFTTIKGKKKFQYPSSIKMTPYTYTVKKFYMFHRDNEHDIEQCFALKKEIEQLIAKGYIQQFVKRDTFSKQDSEESN